MEDRLKTLRVLVIEDDGLMQKLISDVLVKLGFGAITKAANGEAALAILETTPMDFVICDWRMDGMDGLTFTKNVRFSLKDYAFIPIIMLTGNAEVDQVFLARDAGVNEYLIKPFTIKDLCGHLKEIIDHPREFIMASNYIGPSRRRKVLPAANITERRKRRVKPVTRETAYGQMGTSYA